MVDKMTSEGKVDTISVYFRSLNDGPWFGIHENTNYFPASLLKVPIMIAYFKKAESDPSILDKKIYYDPGILKTLGDFNNGEYYPAKEVIMPGQSYTVIDLINRMIEFSDNNAKNLLEINFDSPNELYKVYIDLGFVTPPELRGGGDVLSVHEYASFYRVLYNASYLNQEYSEKALEILSKTDFKRGISESVPNNITISHKFGEYSDNNFKQLHDCGIIYYPKSPYILCVLTRGSDFSNLESVISTISDTVYKEVDKQTKAGSQW
jgi:beta-lactamase class A